MKEPHVDLKLAHELGLNDEEYEKIIKILGRIPSYTELGIFSVMWSEHCSYKNSILLLKTLPRSGDKLLVSAGEENAGLVDIGDNTAVAFKIESHNHPSAVEPYQGAATGVGGILRDIFTMGARPIASLNSLRFGFIEGAEINRKYINRSKYLFKNVVKGIADYGNCFGVPTISGEIYFDECYQDNPLVNAMAVGIVKHNETASAKASGAGNTVFIVGSSTGRDGIHGATFASEEISEKSESKRPSVQVGDPFTEKLLLEATLEVIRSGSIIGIQDMGAAGITCSSSEMSAKGNCGMKINLDEVPLRDKNMTAYEIMLSESQERMLVVVKKGKEDRVKSIFTKWDLNCVQIGEVIDENRLLIFHRNKLEADIPCSELVLGGGAPVYKREIKKPEYLDKTQKFDPNNLKFPNDFNIVLRNLLISPNITNKNWVYEQYDTQVRTNSTLLPGQDASVIRIKKSKKALSLKVDCNSRYCYLDPYSGGLIAVCESARNVVCTGAKPIAITNCLNFGDPYNPEMYYQFSECVRGIGDACRFLGTPVTGGNVSFYNLSKEFAVFPTPVIGMLGLLENVDSKIVSHFLGNNDKIYLLGKPGDSIGGSEYLFRETGLITGKTPEISLQYEKLLQDTILELIQNKIIKSAHDVSEGGIAVALCESAVMNRLDIIGCDIKIETNMREDFVLFGENQSQVIVTIGDERSREFENICMKNNLDFLLIGVTGGKNVTINDKIKISVKEIADLYYNSISYIMDND